MNTTLVPKAQQCIQQCAKQVPHAYIKYLGVFNIFGVAVIFGFFIAFWVAFGLSALPSSHPPANNIGEVFNNLAKDLHRLEQIANFSFYIVAPIAGLIAFYFSFRLWRRGLKALSKVDLAQKPEVFLLAGILLVTAFFGVQFSLPATMGYSYEAAVGGLLVLGLFCFLLVKETCLPALFIAAFLLVDSFIHIFPPPQIPTEQANILANAYHDLNTPNETTAGMFIKIIIVVSVANAPITILGERMANQSALNHITYTFRRVAKPKTLSP